MTRSHVFSIRLGVAAAMLSLFALATATSSFGVTITSGSPSFVRVPSPPYCDATVVTITGSGFVSDGGVTSVAIGGVPQTYTVTADNQIILTVVPGTVSGPIVVTTKAGTATSSRSETVEACESGPATVKPSVRSVPPTVRGGKRIQLVGSGFIGVTKVTLNGSPVTYAIPSDVNMYVVIPTSARNGTVTITLTNAAGTASVKTIKIK